MISHNIEWNDVIRMCTDRIETSHFSSGMGDRWLESYWDESLGVAAASCEGVSRGGNPPPLDHDSVEAASLSSSSVDAAYS